MIHKIKVFLKARKLKNTVKRAKYRIYLWKRILRQEKAVLSYGPGYVSVVRPDEAFLVNHDTMFNLGIVFKATPNGRFVSDESLGNIQLPEEDRHLGFKNPFEEQEEKELKTMGRILTIEERKRKSLISMINRVEDKYYLDF